MLERILLDLRPQTDSPVEVWLANLDIDPVQVADCTQLLSEDERARAERFQLEAHRRRFTVARGTLRRLLGERLDCAPAAIRFDYNKKGKPSLAGAPLHFNVSHAQERVLYGFSKHRQIGVDIEYLEKDVDYVGLAQRFLSMPEQDALAILPVAQRKYAFLSCWTGKEALAKATGDGLALTLEREHFVVIPTLPGAAQSRLIAGHHLYTLAIEGDYVASIALALQD